MQYEIIKNQLQNLGVDKYLLEDVRMEEFGDIELAKNQLAFVYELYFEKEGYCTVDDEEGFSYLEATQGNTFKNTYNDLDENIKTYLYKKVHLFTRSFVFGGTGYNSYLSYVIVTIPEGSPFLPELAKLKTAVKELTVLDRLQQIAKTEVTEVTEKRILL